LVSAVRFPQSHKTVSLKDFETHCRQMLNNQLSELAIKQTEVYRSEKQAWQSVEENERHVAKLTGKVDDFVEKEV